MLWGGHTFVLRAPEPLDSVEVLTPLEYRRVGLGFLDPDMSLKQA